MEEELTRMKLRHTKEEINFLEQFLSSAKENKFNYSPTLRNAAVIGYRLKIDELEKEVLEYENMLSSR
jgi:hypothetical protein